MKQEMKVIDRSKEMSEQSNEWIQYRNEWIQWCASYRTSLCYFISTFEMLCRSKEAIKSMLKNTRREGTGAHGVGGRRRLSIVCGCVYSETFPPLEFTFLYLLLMICVRVFSWFFCSWFLRFYLPHIFISYFFSLYFRFQFYVSVLCVFLELSMVSCFFYSCFI